MTSTPSLTVDDGDDNDDDDDDDDESHNVLFHRLNIILLFDNRIMYQLAPNADMLQNHIAFLTFVNTIA